MPGVVKLHRFGHEAMATFFEVVIAGHDAEYARQAAQVAFCEIDRLESLLSRFDPGSDVAQINRLRPGESLRVRLEVFECLQLAAQVYADTGGAFDITVGPLMDCVRAAQGDWSKLNRADLAAARSRVGMDRLALNPHDFSVGVISRVETDAALRIEVDLGAIGKGYALDKAAELLADWDVTNVLLHSGTSTALALGSDGTHDGWTVGCGGDWGKAEGFESVTLSEVALSGSGTEVKGQHVLDPRTAAPAKNHRAAWAIAPTAALSDALSTAFMVMSTVEVKAYCEAHADVAALVVEKQRSRKDKLVATDEFAALRSARHEKD